VYRQLQHLMMIDAGGGCVVKAGDTGSVSSAAASDDD